VSGDGDTGADPNKLVAITDWLKNTTATAATNEKFFTIRGAGFGEVLRGVLHAGNRGCPRLVAPGVTDY